MKTGRGVEYDAIINNAMIIINKIVGISHHFLVFQRNFTSSFKDSNIYEFYFIIYQSLSLLKIGDKKVKNFE
jgi:hypothetical protein